MDELQRKQGLPNKNTLFIISFTKPLTIKHYSLSFLSKPQPSYFLKKNMSLNMEKQTLEKHYSSSHTFLKKKKKTFNLVSLYLKPKLSLNLSHFQPSFSKRTSPLSSSQILLIKPLIILKQQLMHQHQLKIKREKNP